MTKILKKDEVGNLCIKVPASKGCESVDVETVEIFYKQLREVLQMLCS